MSKDKLLKYIIIAIFFLGLALIRLFENDLFYDPYLLFFQNDYLYLDSPRQEVLKLTLYTSLRFLMNTGLSILILYAFFKDIGVIKFASIIYVVSYVILIVLFLFFVLNPMQERYYLFFNVRRFLIQPILLLLLLPAFYYARLDK